MNFIVVVALALYATAALFLAKGLGDPEVVKKSGALLGAIGALLTVFQAFVEENLEKNEEGDSDSRPSGISLAYADVIAAIRRRRSTGRAIKRWTLIIGLGLTLMLAELLHGFGDDFYGLLWPDASDEKVAPRFEDVEK
ncbi:hypothetical protein [Caulobacter sp. NIBR1757]|uniref:hypothetical protein n=1 Tax=Caulobacter sp. NIBR1757 TaxID=3016000 RepID=UPI0022F0A376|nr:hypothetical protein [Caulobacter sp. NIBR1757]